MSATDTSAHYFFEAKPRLAAKVGAGGVASAGATTIPHTFVGLDEGDAYIVTVNRTDATGTTKNPAASTETFIGKVSGTNFINCVRAVEGTAQAWAADTVLELLVTATSLNKLIEGIELEHNQDGTHKETALDSMITGSEAQGDIIYHNGTIWTRLPKGTGSQGLRMNSGATAPEWVTESSATETFTNKRITKRITTITSHATPTINTDNCDCVTITAQAEAITSMTTNLSGTPTNFQTLVIRIKDNGTARAITWGASFEAKGVALPTTTVLSKVLTAGFIYDTVSAKWGCVGVSQEF